MKRVTKAVQKRRDLFNAEVITFVQDLGGKPLDDNYRPAVTIETLAGRLVVTPIDDWIATRFDEPRRAADLLGNGFTSAVPGFGVNPFSGKWNFHATTPEGSVEHFKAALPRILPRDDSPTA